MFTYLHPHTPFPPFSPSLISLVVSVDVKRHVYLLAFRPVRADDDTEARRLAKEVRVLIWVMTSPKTLQSRARRVRDTWGTRANLLLFFSSEEDKEFPAIGLNVSEGREHLLSKTVKAFRYIYKHHLDDADWFMKVGVLCRKVAL